MLCVVWCGVPLSASLHNPRQAHKGNIILSDIYATGAIRLFCLRPRIPRTFEHASHKYSLSVRKDSSPLVRSLSSAQISFSI
jgi:hypothetical protein